jgi:endonuclease/exonuclease/phosphatase family metal-dependent hydrolase
MKKALTFLALGTGAAALGVTGFYLWASQGSYPGRDYAQTFTTDAPKPEPGQDRFTVVSYNIGYLSGATNNLAVARSQALFDQNLQNAIATLGPLKADFIALQEIDLDSRRSYYVNQVTALAENLSFAHRGIAVNWDKNYVPFPYWPPSAHFGKILSAQAVLSRYPITEQERFVLEPVASKPFFYKALYLDRLAQVTKVDIDGKPLVLVNVHLEAFDFTTRLNQARIVTQIAEAYAKDHPVLLVGDFNSALNRSFDTPKEALSGKEGQDELQSEIPYAINLIEASPQFASVVPPEQWSEPQQLTYPADAPQYKLDYIFYTPDSLELVEAGVVTGANQASDHLPIRATFKLK